MKKLAIVMITIGAMLSGCVAFEVPLRDGGARHADRDRDGDGVPNREDRRPNDPRRY